MSTDKFLIMNLKTVISKGKRLSKNFFNSFQSEGEISKQSPVWMQSTLIGLMASASFGVVWLSISKTDEIVTVTGKL